MYLSNGRYYYVLLLGALIVRSGCSTQPVHSFSLVPSLVDPSETAQAEIYQGFVIHTRSITTVSAPL